MTDDLKDFDSERRVPRETMLGFRIGGVEFSARTAVKPEVVSEWEILAADATLEQQTAMLDGTIKAFLPDDQHERWHELRARKDAPVSLQELYAVMGWLWEINADRPTPASPSSSGLPASDAPSSTDASASPEETQAG